MVRVCGARVYALMFAAHNMMLAGAKKSAVTFSALTSSSSNTVTLPTHAVGNIIIIVATSGVQDPTVPTASGTVPTWVNIQNGSASDGSNYMSFRVYYTIATATNHTSGNWALGGGGTMASAVFTGNKTSSPIGGKTKAGDNFPSSTATVTAPSITLTDTSGRSAIVQNWFRASANFSGSTYPSGYTTRWDSGGVQAFSTKDVTTSDGTADVTMDTSTTNPWAAVQFEILAS